jgi:phage tail sheath protein FI
MAYNDQVAYPWFAPAGLTRGVVTNASNVGYINAEGEFIPLSLTTGQRDTLYGDGSRVGINPIARFPGQGLYVFGQRTLQSFSSALDRVNVSRLLAYLRERFDPLARPFIFEPNDKLTRANVKQVFDGFLGDLLAKRAIYDFIVVCDETNNTPAKIDRNELWIDIAIEPVKAAEFIYIPIRVVNTGELS